MFSIHGWAEKIAKGSFLTPEEGLQVMESTPTQALVEEADHLKRLLHGNRVSFVDNVNQTLNNICFHDCCFCRYATQIGSRRAYVALVGDLLDHIARFPDATEICMQGGVFPKLRFSYYKELVREVRRAYPNLHIHAFSPTEIQYMAEDSDQSTGEVLDQLKALGLDSMPGTAAEILVDEVRDKICSMKINTATWVRIIQESHERGIPTNATMLFGHIETPAQVAKHLEVIRRVQETTKGFTEFIPFLFLPGETPMETSGRKGDRFVNQEYIKRVYAFSRLYLGTALPHLQTSWSSLGLETALESIGWGCDDFSGTLWEVPIEEPENGNQGRPIPASEMRALLARAGMEPWQRDTLYRPVLSKIAVA